MKISRMGKGYAVTVAASVSMTLLKVTESCSAPNWSLAERLFWNLYESTRALIGCEDIRQYLHY
jgi:hypothetical protein